MLRPKFYLWRIDVTGSVIFIKDSNKIDLLSTILGPGNQIYLKVELIKNISTKIGTQFTIQ